MLVCVFPCALLHARPRVQRAPGFPCALLLLSRVKIDAKLGRIAPRECEVVFVSTRCLKIESADIYRARMRATSPPRSSPGLTGGPGLTEAVAMESRGRGVLAPPLSRRMTSSVPASMGFAKRSTHPTHYFA